ncbi:MAG: hypothetical protein ACTSVI_10340 [Promethearchaeota archaeon]
MEVITKIRNRKENLSLLKNCFDERRIRRGKLIKNSFVTSLSCSKKGIYPVEINSSIQGSSIKDYIAYFKVEKDGSGFVVHDCPDFKKRLLPCKHLAKILLILDEFYCKTVCENLSRLNFITSSQKIQEIREMTENQKAQKMISANDVSGAINALVKAKKMDDAVELAFFNKDFCNVIKLTSRCGIAPSQDPTLLTSVNNMFLDVKDQTIREQLEVFKSLIQCLDNQNLKDVAKVSKILNLKNFKLLPTELKLFFIQKTGFFDINLDELFPEISKSTIRGEKKNLKSLLERARHSFYEKIVAFISEMRNLNEIEAIKEFLELMNLPLSKEITAKINKYRRDLRILEKIGLKKKFQFLKGMAIEHLKTNYIRDLNLRLPWGHHDYIYGGIKFNDPPITRYILNKVGFLSSHQDYIKKRDYILNFPILRELFRADLLINEAKEYWGDEFDKVTCQVRENAPQIDVRLNLQDAKRVLIVEWDLAPRPIQGSHVCAFKDGNIIPQQGDPLTSEIEPFEVTLCKKEPVIIRNDVTILKPLRKLTIPEAIKLAYEGIQCISANLPFHILNEIHEGEIEPFQALQVISSTIAEKFIPTGSEFEKKFTKLLSDTIFSDLEKFFDAQKKIIKDQEELERLAARLSGADTLARIFKRNPLKSFFKSIRLKSMSLASLQASVFKKIREILSERIKKNPVEPPGVHVEKLMLFPQFKRQASFILMQRKKQLEAVKIVEKTLPDNGKIVYDITELKKTCYGRRILKETLEIDESKLFLTEQEFSELQRSLDFINVKIPVVSHD